MFAVQVYVPIQSGRYSYSPAVSSMLDFHVPYRNFVAPTRVKYRLEIHALRYRLCTSEGVNEPRGHNGVGCA